MSAAVVESNQLSKYLMLFWKLFCLSLSLSYIHTNLDAALRIFCGLGGGLSWGSKVTCRERGSRMGQHVGLGLLKNLTFANEAINTITCRSLRRNSGFHAIICFVQGSMLDRLLRGEAINSTAVDDALVAVVNSNWAVVRGDRDSEGEARKLLTRCVNPRAQSVEQRDQLPALESLLPFKSHTWPAVVSRLLPDTPFCTRRFRRTLDDHLSAVCSLSPLVSPWTWHGWRTW